jgi:outer membrane autotransporter protein
LDEDTSAALTIDSAITLTIGASVDLNHTINGSDVAFGTIITSAGVTVNQNAAIGGVNIIDSLSVGAGSVFNVNSSLLTDQSGGDIDLSTGGIGGTLALNDGAIVRAQIDGEGVGVVTSNGTAFISGQVDDSTLDVQSGTLTVNGSMGQGLLDQLQSVSVQSGATLSLNTGVTSTAFIDLDGTLELSSNASVTVGTYNAAANGGRIEMGLDRNTGVVDAPSLTFTTGGPVNLNNVVFAFEMERGSEVLETETISGVIVGNGGATVLPNIDDTSFLYDYTLVQNVNNVDLNIVRGDVTGSALTRNNAVVANEILLVLPEATGFTAGANIADLQKALADASTQGEYNEILESVLPTLDAAPSAAAENVLTQTLDIAGQRILHLRQPARRVDPSAVEPASGGSSQFASNERSSEAAFSEGGRLWASAFTSTGDQGDRDGIDGYDFDANGVVVGADTGRLSDKWVFGLAGTYGVSDSQSDNANSAEVEVTSYQLSGYMTYNTDSDYFINNVLTYGLHDNVSQRNNVGSIGLQANAQYDSEQISFYNEIGADFKKGKMVVTPSFSSHYTFYETEDYRERDAGDLNLTVDEGSRQSLAFGPKVVTQWVHPLDNGLNFIPEVNASYSYDVIGDDVSASALIEGGGANSLKLNGFESQSHDINLGLAASLVGQAWDVKALYDYEWSGDLTSHAAGLHGIYKF